MAGWGRDGGRKGRRESQERGEKREIDRQTPIQQPLHCPNSQTFSNTSTKLGSTTPLPHFFSAEVDFTRDKKGPASGFLALSNVSISLFSVILFNMTRAMTRKKKKKRLHTTADARAMHMERERRRRKYEERMHE